MRVPYDISPCLGWTNYWVVLGRVEKPWVISDRSVDVARSLVQGTRKYSENLGRLSESIVVSFLVIYDRGCQIRRPEKRKTTESSTGILNVDSYVVIWPSNFAFHSNLPISETTTGGAERQFHQRDPNSNISKRKDKVTEEEKENKLKWRKSSYTSEKMRYYGKKMKVFCFWDDRIFVCIIEINISKMLPNYYVLKSYLTIFKKL